MLKKIVTLAVGIMIASVLALPAFATPPAGKGKPASTACLQAVAQAGKTFHQGLRDARKAHRDVAKAARETFRNQSPAPTGEQRKAFHKQQVAAWKTLRDQQKAARETFRGTQKTAIEACKA